MINPYLVMGKSKKINESSDVKIVRKPSFGSPFCISWPEISRHKNYQIIEEIKKEMPTYLSGRIPAKGQFQKSMEKFEKDSIGKKSYTEFILLGINAVTKALESGPLSLVLVCKSAKPAVMTQHLIPLCVMQNTDGCCVAGLSDAVASVLGIKSVLAVGFKVKKENPLSDLIAFIIDKVPTLDVPWLNVWKQNQESTNSKKKLLTPHADEIKILNDVNKEERNESNDLSNPHISAHGTSGNGAVNTSQSHAKRSSGNTTDAGRRKSDDQHSKDTLNIESSLDRQCKHSPKMVKHKIEDVSYHLIETNYQMFDVPIKKKK